MTNFTTQDEIEFWEDRIRAYKRELAKEPNSVFYTGMVKNSEELIEELKERKKREESRNKK